MYIGKIRFYGEQEENNRFGSKLVLSFYNSTTDEFETTRIIHKDVDKCFSLIMKICDLVLEKDHYSNMVITENKTFNPNSNLYKDYKFKIVFKAKKLINE